MTPQVTLRLLCSAWRHGQAAYAGLGRKEDAIREGQLAVELLPVAKEA